MPIPRAAELIRAALLSSLLILTACGQKGPLYLPQDPNASTEAVSSESTAVDAAEEKDKPKATVPADSLD